jgi:hypothetical protein
MNQLISLGSRILFLGAFLMAALAAWEKVANLLDLTLLRGTIFPSRLLELAAIALLFVIALQLRELKVTLDAGKR